MEVLSGSTPEYRITAEKNSDNKMIQTQKEEEAIVDKTIASSSRTLVPSIIPIKDNIDRYDT
jgi:hypothetical protein